MVPCPKWSKCRKMFLLPPGFARGDLAREVLKIIVGKSTSEKSK